MKLSQFCGRRLNVFITKEKQNPHRVVIPAQVGIQLLYSAEKITKKL